MANVEQVGLTLQQFSWPDYFVFALMLLASALIGVYYGFCVGNTSTAEYLMGGRHMQTIPVAMSLIASYTSGIALLGIPTEIYVYGSQHMYTFLAVIITGAVMAYTFLPVFHDLQLASTYEYLEMRFNKNVRLLCSFLFILASIAWLTLVIYLPALALNQVTGINVHVITPIVCLVCIFYTCVGGLRAVVWSDVLQTCIMVGAMVLVIVKGTVDVGGFKTVWDRNYNSGRLEAPNLSPNMYERHTFWGLVIGGFAFCLQTNVANQAQVQRFLVLETLKSAQIALWIFVFGCILILCICGYAGLLIFATYHSCDPLTTKLVMARDQLLPLLVMDVLGGYPGIPGIFVAGVFSAAFSTLSTGLNSLAVVVWEDFYKSYSKRQLTDRQTDCLVKGSVVFFGALCVALVFVVEKLGTVIQLAVSLTGIAYGAMLGLFCMGLFLPWVNSTGALVGGITGLVIMSWLNIGTEAGIASGRISFNTKPVSVVGCSYNFTSTLVNTSSITPDNPVFSLYRLSYVWSPLINTIITMLVGLIYSLITGVTNLSTLNPILVSPIIRRWLPKRKQQSSQLVSLLPIPT